jgi:DNA-binding MarR family transcriptional regulator
MLTAYVDRPDKRLRYCRLYQERIVVVGLALDGAFKPTPQSSLLLRKFPGLQKVGCKMCMYMHNTKDPDELHGMAGDSINLDEVGGCTCLRARRAARYLTRLYDAELQPTGLTVNQLGLLAKLLGAKRRGLSGLPVGSLAELVGMHFSTLNRNIKPLIRQGLLNDRSSSNDGRVREVFITEKGQARLRDAIPAWRRAQLDVHDALGHEVMLSLNALLDLVNAKIAPLPGGVRPGNPRAT